MIHELRIYTAAPGRLPDVIARFRDHTIRIWERHGIRQAGFWTTLVGGDSNELTYLLAWDSMADRETRWAAFMADPEWIKVKGETEANGVIVARVANSFLAPTAFSSVR